MHYIITRLAAISSGRNSILVIFVMWKVSTFSKTKRVKSMANTWIWYYSGIFGPMSMYLDPSLVPRPHFCVQAGYNTTLLVSPWVEGQSSANECTFMVLLIE